MLITGYIMWTVTGALMARGGYLVHAGECNSQEDDESDEKRGSEDASTTDGSRQRADEVDVESDSDELPGIRSGHCSACGQRIDESGVVFLRDDMLYCSAGCRVGRPPVGAQRSSCHKLGFMRSQGTFASQHVLVVGSVGDFE